MLARRAALSNRFYACETASPKRDAAPVHTRLKVSSSQSMAAGPSSAIIAAAVGSGSGLLASGVGVAAGLGFYLLRRRRNRTLATPNVVYVTDVEGNWEYRRPGVACARACLDRSRVVMNTQRTGEEE